MYVCKICKEEFEDAGDIGMHLAFGHNLALDTDHPDGLTKEDFPPEMHGLIDVIDQKAQEAFNSSQH